MSIPALCKTNKDIPSDLMLGNLIFMNMVDMKITKDEFKQIFKNNGIPESFIREISPADAFRRASASIAGKLGDSKIEVDEVRTDAQGIKRIIGEKRADCIYDTMEYEPIVELFFNRANQTASYSVLKMQDPKCFDLGKQVVDTFNEWSVYHTKDTIRNTIKRIVDYMHPINLMPTGLCKFIPAQHTQIVNGLKEALESLSAYSVNPSESNICEIIPVINTEEQQNLVMKNFKSEIEKEMLDTVTELKDVLQTKQGLTTRAVNSYIEKFKYMQEKVADYETLLGVYMDVMRQQIAASIDLVNNSKM